MGTKPEVVMVPLGQLIPWPGNPRRHRDDDVSAVVRSIKAYGWTNPVLAQKGSNRVLAGHGRLMAAKKAGIAEVPVIFLDLDDRKAAAYTVADNRLAELSEWDMTALRSVLTDLDDGEFDIELTGFDPESIAKMFAGPEDDDEEDEDRVPKKVECPKCHHEFFPKKKRGSK